MKYCIESKYSSVANGPSQVVSIVNSVDELLQQLRAALEQPGWSDSVLINVEELPEPAIEAWHNRARLSTKRSRD